jgi:hypothetical protein
LFGTPEQSKGITAAMIQHDPGAATATTTGPGVYCFGGLGFTPKSAMVSPDSAGDLDTNVIASVAIQRGANLGNCNADHQQARVSLTLVNDTAAPVLTDHRFFIWFE